MPRILKRLLGLAKSQPGLTPPSAQLAPPKPAAPPPPPDPAKCKHVFAPFILPAEGKGRVWQCQLCRGIGFRTNRFGGPGNSPEGLSKSIRLYDCSREGCKGVAVRRMTGRGPRGCYIWSCAEHGVQAEGHPTP